MSLYKRGSVYWIRFTNPDGRELRETAQTGDRKKAQEYHDARKAECWRIAKLGERPRYTWKEAVVRWLGENPHSRWLRDIKRHLRDADPILGELELTQIDRNTLDRLTRARLNTGVAPATVNRMLATIRSILNTSRKDWDWLICLQGATRHPCQQSRLAQGAPAGQDQEFPLARFAPYVGILACTGRDAVERAAGTRRLGDHGHGAEIRPPGR
jgi:hypothetical protein